MSELSALAVAKLHSLGHAAMAVPRESRLKLAFVSSGIVGLWVVTLVVAWRSFRFVDRYGAELLGGAPVSIVELLVPRLVGVFAFFLLVMLTFSSALLAHATLFRSREMAFLLATPASVRAIALSRFAEIVLLASWATAYLGSPVLLAYGAVRAAPWPFYAWAVMAFVPFVVIPASLGTLVAVLAARLVPRLPRWVLLAIGGGCLAAVFLLFQGRVRGVLVLGGSVNVASLLEISGQAEHEWLPSFWYSAATTAAARDDGPEATFWLLLLVANGMLAALVVTEAADRLLYAGWNTLASTSPRERRACRGGGLLERGLACFPPATRALLIKDIRLFSREPTQWSQALVFFGVLALYVANLRVPSQGYGVQFWQGLITALNTAAALLVLATLTTRFVFPLVSLEGRRFWILGLAPLTVRELLTEKLLLAAVATSIVTGALATVSAWRLGLTPLPFAFSVATVLVASVALSALAVGLGAVFPDFGAENPSRIVSGLGGTVTFLLSVVYVVLVAALETVALRWQPLRAVVTGSLPSSWVPLWSGLGIAALSALTAWLPMRLGCQRLTRAEL